MLPPFKGGQTTDEEEFTRIHQSYRARAEKAFAGNSIEAMNTLLASGAGLKVVQQVLICDVVRIAVLTKCSVS